MESTFFEIGGGVTAPKGFRAAAIRCGIKEGTSEKSDLGLIPIAATIFWGPMAFAIMGGLFVATILTLIVLPALYITWFRVKEPVVGELTPVTV